VNPHYKGGSSFNLAGAGPNVARCGAFPENVELSFTGSGIDTEGGFNTADAELQLLSRSVAQNRLIDEFILRFTHTIRMDWFAPGIDATGRRLVVPHVCIIAFENGKISSEHIYWDQATVLTQMGLLNKSLPVIGETQCDRLLDANAPVNQLIKRGAPDS
jgi:hypothetical protein